MNYAITFPLIKSIKAISAPYPMETPVSKKSPPPSYFTLSPDPSSYVKFSK